jgi:hypothetical protein
VRGEGAWGFIEVGVGVGGVVVVVIVGCVFFCLFFLGGSFVWVCCVYVCVCVVGVSSAVRAFCGGEGLTTNK